MMFEYSVLNFVCFVTVYLLIKLAPVSLCTAYYSNICIFDLSNSNSSVQIIPRGI